MAGKLVLIATAALMVAVTPTVRDFADAESSGITFGRSNRNAALLAEASSSTPGGHGTSPCTGANGPTLGSRNTVLFAGAQSDGAVIDATPGPGMG
jgi:hypothetical protein